jgi:8-oxo-dGTP pyrophosphatase MutT (NUDIX family)/MFS family permease
MVSTGIGDVVVLAADGHLHTDALVLPVLLELARTHPQVLRDLLVHELTHLRHGRWREARVQRRAPLPAAWPGELRAAVAQAAQRVLGDRLARVRAQLAQADELAATDPGAAGTVFDRVERAVARLLHTGPGGARDPVVVEIGLDLVEARMRLVAELVERGRALLAGGDRAGAGAVIGQVHAVLGRAEAVTTVLLGEAAERGRIADWISAAWGWAENLRQGIDPGWQPQSWDGVATSAGFVPVVGGDGLQAVRMDTGFGPLLMTGQHLGADHALTGPASMVRHLGLQARWWLSEGLDDWARAVAVLELVAEAATGLAPIAHADSAGLHVRRYDFGREIAVMWWDAGASTSQADLVTWVSASGEQVLVGFHPVRAGSPLGPVEQGEQRGGGRGSVVAFQDAAGRAVATGVVVKAATPDGPAHVVTPLHVVVENTPQRPLTVAGLPIAGWVKLPVEGFGPSSDLARAAYAQQVGGRWRPLPLDTVDLALVAVFGLGAPAAELGSSSPQVGQSVLVDGYPAGQRTALQVPVTAAQAGHVRGLGAVGGGMSGGIGVDSAGRVTLIVVASSATEIVAIGPELLGTFVRLATPLLDGVLGTAGVQAARDIATALGEVENLVGTLTADLEQAPWKVLATLDEDPTVPLYEVRQMLGLRPVVGAFAELSARADALQTELDRLAELAVTRLTAMGVEPAQVPLVAGVGSAVLGFENLARLWAGDLGRTWQDVLGFIGEDPAGFLSFERAQLATAPAVEPFTELAARLDAVQGRIQEIHAAALAHRRDGPAEQPGRGGSQLSLHPIAVLGGAALAYLALGVTGPVAAVATPIALAAGIAGVVWVGMRWGQHLGSGKEQKAPAGSAGVLDGPGTVRGLVGVVRWAVRVAVVVATATALVLLPAAAAAGPAGAGELAQGASSGHTDVGPMLLVAGVVAAVVLWVAERKAESVRRLLTRVGLFVLGGVVGLGVGVVYGGWIGLVVGLVLVGPELLALAFTVIPEMLERQPTEWLRTVAVFWLKHGPPVLLRIGFLAGVVWLLLGCGECAAATAVSPPLVTATVQRIRGFTTALVRWVGAHRWVVRVAVGAALVVAALAVLDGDAAAAAVAGGKLAVLGNPPADPGVPAAGAAVPVTATAAAGAGAWSATGVVAAGVVAVGVLMLLRHALQNRAPPVVEPIGPRITRAVGTGWPARFTAWMAAHPGAPLRMALAVGIGLVVVLVGGHAAAGAAMAGAIVPFRLTPEEAAEVEDLIRRKFRGALKRYEVLRSRLPEDITRLGHFDRIAQFEEATERLRFALEAARARRDQSRDATERARLMRLESPPVVQRVLLEVVAGYGAVTLDRLAQDLERNPQRLAHQLGRLADLGLVQVALKPLPLVYGLPRGVAELLAEPGRATGATDDAASGRAALVRRLDELLAQGTLSELDENRLRTTLAALLQRRPAGDDVPEGGAVATVRMDDSARHRVIARLLAVLARSRPLSGEEFPHLARGPPEAVRLVRIVEDDLDDGGVVIGFGLRDAAHAPDGVIAVPGRVARVVEALIAADPELADWWRRFLDHELGHVNGAEHTGERHDAEAAGLAREFDEQWLGRAAREDPALRRTRVGDWNPEFLRELSALAPEDALLAVLDAQGMGERPTLVSGADWREQLAAGHQPMYRGIYAEQAPEQSREQAEEFRTGERPFVGWAAQQGGSGHNFSTDPATAGRYAAQGWIGLPNPFRPMRPTSAADAVLIGYLRREARVLDTEEAVRRRDADVAAALERAAPEVAELLADLGVWAALSGIDAVAGPLSVVLGWASSASARIDRHYLVVNRGAMLVETAEPRVVDDLWAGERDVNCRCGEQHLGIYGGASLMLVHRAADGSVWVLMHRRGAGQHRGTWALPGGARGLRETAQRTAMRETWEEARLAPAAYTVPLDDAGPRVYVDDHGDWSHTTVLAETDSKTIPSGRSDETAELAWVLIEDVHTLELHPGFAASWPAVAAALLGRTIAPAATTPAPQQPGQPGAGEAPQPDAAHAVPGPAPRTVLRAGGVVNRSAGFRAFWSGQVLSDIGTQVTALAVPLLAVTVIHASTVQVGLLAFFAYLSAVVVTLPAGAVVDRIPNHRNLLVLVQVARAGVMAWIPTAGVLGVLSLWQLYAVVLVEGALAVFFRVAAQSFLPVLAEGDPRRLREYNSKLATTQSGAQAALPAATAGVVGVIGAATTIVLDVVASLASAFALARLRLRDLVEVPVEPRGPVWAELIGDLRYIARHPVLKVLAVRSTSWNLFVSTVRALTVIFLVEQLHAKPWLVGVSLALAAVGGVGGAVLGRRLADRVGSARALLLNAVWLGPGYLMLAAARPGWGVALAVVALLATNVAASSSTVISMAYLQNAAPSPVRARVIAAYDWSARLGMPVGAVVGGVMATVVGMQWTLLGATLGMWAGSVLWLVFSPIRTVRDLEAITDGGRGPAGPADPTGKAGARTGALVRIVLRALARVRAALTALRHLISRRGPPSPPLGGAATIGDEPIDDLDRAAVAHIVTWVRVARALPAGHEVLRVLSGGLPASVFTAAGGRGVRVVKGLNDLVRERNGPPGLVSWAAVDGWIYLDRAVYKALLDGALDAPDRQRLFRHELIHIMDPALSEQAARAHAELPDLSPLAEAAGVGPRVLAGLVEMHDRHGRRVWQASELGPRLHPQVHRMVGITGDGELLGSGFLDEVVGRRGRVATNQHVVLTESGEVRTGIEVLVSTPGGVRAVPGRVRSRPHARTIARELVAGRATGGLTDAQLERAAAVLDAAVIEIESDDLLAIPLPALEFMPVGIGVPVVAVGGPRGTLQVAGPSGRISDRESTGREPVISGGVTAVDPRLADPGLVDRLPQLVLDVLVVGDEWIWFGSSGGPLFGAGAASRADGVIGLVQGGSRSGYGPARAIGAPALAAFLRASGPAGAAVRRGAPAPDSGGGAGRRGSSTTASTRRTARGSRRS